MIERVIEFLIALREWFIESKMFRRVVYGVLAGVIVFTVVSFIDKKESGVVAEISAKQLNADLFSTEIGFLSKDSSEGTFIKNEVDGVVIEVEGRNTLFVVPEELKKELTQLKPSDKVLITYGQNDAGRFVLSEVVKNGNE